MAAKIKIGNSNLSKCYVGNKEVSKIYVGNKLVYQKQSSGYTINIIAGRNVTDTTNSAKLYFKFNSNSVSTSDYDGYVSEYGVLSGPSTYTNVTSMAFVSASHNTNEDCVIFGSTHYNYSDNVQVIQINSSGDIYINGLENTGPQ